MALTLIIGNKNYSSWSMRPWFAMTAAGIPFEEILIPLYEPGSAERMIEYSPAGKVPILLDDGIRVWESLAIIEYLAEKFPQSGLWPNDPAARAHARAICSEMHAGFQPLRRECPMNMWHPPRAQAESEDVEKNVRRIVAIWEECCTLFGAEGPFLFGRIGAADAMFAPVVSRFLTWGISTSVVSESYMAAITDTPAWQSWRGAALQESWVMSHNEPDWPEVPRLTT